MQPNIKDKNGELSRGPLTSPPPGEARPHVRNQTPHESLGLSGKGGLMKASIQAGVLFAVVFAVLTFVPFVLEKTKDTATANPAPTATPNEKTDETSPNTAPQPTPKPEGTPKGSPTAGGKVPGKDDLLNKLGETGTKTGAPKTKDPFKTNDDDLLK